MAMAEKVEEYIWGKIDENDYLGKIVASESFEAEKLLSKVEAVQCNINLQLRRGVEENYPRLLEQVDAIEPIEKVLVGFQRENEHVFVRAEQMANVFGEHARKLNAAINAIRNLTRLNRLFQDSLRLVELTKIWNNESKALIRTDIVDEMMVIQQTNNGLHHLKFLNEQFFFQFDKIWLTTRKDLLAQIRSTMKSLNASAAALHLKALKNLLEEREFQKDMNIVVSESVAELNSIVGQLNDQPTQEKSGRILTQFGMKFSSQLEQFFLLGPEISQIFARRISLDLVPRIPNSALYANKFLQTLSKCLFIHEDSSSNAILDSLKPLKAAILQQSLEKLTAIVYTILREETKSSIIVETIKCAIKKELESANWDPAMQKQMHENIDKVLGYISMSIEQRLKLTDDVLKFTLRPSQIQEINYELMNVTYQLSRLFADFSAPLLLLLNNSLLPIMDRIKHTTSIVLESMHDEDLSLPLSPSASCSEYAKELCNHQKVFRTHLLQIHAFTESIENSGVLLNFIVEQFLLNISLVRSLNIQRAISDLDCLYREIQRYGCKYVKIANSHEQIKSFINTLPHNFESLEQITEYTVSIPRWFIVQMLISTSNASDKIHLPHESIGWTVAEYVHWFNEHSDTERYQFLHNLLNSYKQSVIAQGITEFAHNFPLMIQIIESS